MTPSLSFLLAYFALPLAIVGLALGLASWERLRRARAAEQGFPEPEPELPGEDGEPEARP